MAHLPIIAPPQPIAPRRGRSELDTGVLRLAAIDVGSNSLHMVVAQADADGGVTTLWRLKEMVGLGRISFPSHRLSQEAMDRGVVALRRFLQETQRRGCEKVLAVATSAVREAENGGDFIERVRRELGLHVRVVSARDEARLIYHGVRHAMDLRGGPHLIVDIGGGSVEFIVADDERAFLLESRKLGAARMTARYVKSDPIEAGEIKALLAHYDREISGLVEAIKAYGPVRAIGTSGTLENLAAMSGAEAQGDTPPVLERAAFTRMLDGLLETSSEERGKMRGLDDQRKDQVLAGALLVNEIFRRLDIKQLRLCRSALREGILVEYLARHLPELRVRREVPDPRRRSVLDLARRCDWHQSHAEQVARLCMMLFDQTGELHRLGKRQRELIEYGALLHDIGGHIGRDKHHKHSMYLILHGDLKGFTQSEIAIIANIARYHRKSAPRREHKLFRTLKESDRRIVRVGAALLRIADGLDRSSCGVVSAVKCLIKKRRVAVRVQGRADCELEIWSARKRGGLFAAVFEKTVSFTAKRSR